MQFSLSQIAKTKGAFRPITSRSTEQVTLYRLYREPIAAWRSIAAGIIAGSYLSALQSGDVSSIAADIDSHDTDITDLLASLGLYQFFLGLEAWQRGRWVAEVLRTTRVDPSIMLETPRYQPLAKTRAQRRAGGVVNAARVVRVTPAGLTPSATLSGIDARLAAAVAENASLVKSVSNDTRARIANAVFAGVRAQQSPTEVARAINKGLRLSNERAKKIAKQQVNSAVKQLTLFRFEEAGFEEAVWHHLAGQKHPRREHIAKDGNRYALSNPVWAEMSWDGCHCWPVASWPKP